MQKEVTLGQDMLDVDMLLYSSKSSQDMQEVMLDVDMLVCTELL